MTSPTDPSDRTARDSRPSDREDTDGKRRALERMVSLRGEDIIMYREPPDVTKLSMDLFWRRTQELIATLDRYYILVDLTGTRPPSAEVRARLREHYSQIQPVHVAAFTGKNFILNVAVKFVLGKVMGGLSYSVHKTMDEAIAAIDRARAG